MAVGLKSICWMAWIWPAKSIRITSRLVPSKVSAEGSVASHSVTTLTVRPEPGLVCDGKVGVLAKPPKRSVWVV